MNLAAKIQRIERFARKPKGLEQRVDFAAIEQLYDMESTDVDEKVRAELRKTRDALLNKIEQADKQKQLTAHFVVQLKLDSGPNVPAILETYLTDIWRKGRDIAMKEIPAKIAGKLDALKKFAVGFTPELALDYLAMRSLILKGIIDGELLRLTQMQLMEHLKGGRTLNETLGNLRSIFEPWVGDPTKIGPSGQTGIGFPPGEKAPENILMAYRLENIIRTETTNALAQGRLGVADAMGDYVLGFQLSAILDERTTEVCIAGDGLTFRKEDPAAVKLTPGLHFQCRTLEVFVTTDDVPVKWSTQARIDKVVRLIPEGFK